MLKLYPVLVRKHAFEHELRTRWVSKFSFTEKVLDLWPYLLFVGRGSTIGLRLISRIVVTLTSRGRLLIFRIVSVSPNIVSCLISRIVSLTTRGRLLISIISLTRLHGIHECLDGRERWGEHIEFRRPSGVTWRWCTNHRWHSHYSFLSRTRKKKNNGLNRQRVWVNSSEN